MFHLCFMYFPKSIQHTSLQPMWNESVEKQKRSLGSCLRLYWFYIHKLAEHLEGNAWFNAAVSGCTAPLLWINAGWNVMLCHFALISLSLRWLVLIRNKTVCVIQTGAQLPYLIYWWLLHCELLNSGLALDFGDPTFPQKFCRKVSDAKYPVCLMASPALTESDLIFVKTTMRTHYLHISTNIIYLYIVYFKLTNSRLIQAPV